MVGEYGRIPFYLFSFNLFRIFISSLFYFQSMFFPTTFSFPLFSPLHLSNFSPPPPSTERIQSHFLSKLRILCWQLVLPDFFYAMGHAFIRSNRGGGGKLIFIFSVFFRDCSRISSDPTFKEGHVRFIMVPLIILQILTLFQHGNNQFSKYLVHSLLDKTFKSTVVYRTCFFLNGGSL